MNEMFLRDTGFGLYWEMCALYIASNSSDSLRLFSGFIVCSVFDESVLKWCFINLQLQLRYNMLRKISFRPKLLEYVLFQGFYNRERQVQRHTKELEFW